MLSVATKGAAAPLGHYSQAIKANGFVFVSGILGIKPDDEAITVRDFETQTLIVLENLREILEAAGTSLENVVKVNIYACDIDRWSSANAIYEKFFPNHRPARSFVTCTNLHHGFEIEIDAVATA